MLVGDIRQMVLQDHCQSENKNIFNEGLTDRAIMVYSHYLDRNVTTSFVGGAYLFPPPFGL